MKNISRRGFFALILLTAGCAPTVSFDVMRPAQGALSGSERSIAVLPLRPSAYAMPTWSRFSPHDYLTPFDRVQFNEQAILTEIYHGLETGVVRSGYLDLISVDAVRQALMRGAAPSPVDLYLTGETAQFTVHDEEIPPASNRRRPQYRRQVDFALKYRVVTGHDGRIIATDVIKMSRRSGSEYRIADLPSPHEMLSDDIQRAIAVILSQIQPHTVRRSIELLKNKEFPQLQEIIKTAESGATVEARTQFDRLYQQTGVFEAGYNAARLYEVTGDYQEAARRMQHLAHTDGRPEALKALREIQTTIQENARLQQQLQ